MTRSPRLIWLFAFALFARAVIPAGWMPSVVPGQAIMLCTDTGLQQAWVDADGKLHKSDPAEQHDQSPCAFAGLGAALDAPTIAANVPAPSVYAAAIPAFPATLSIGRGLAAPPPPKTGPPLNA